MSKKPRGAATLRPAKRRLFALLSVLGSLLVVAAVEVVLRCFGFGGYVPVIREVGQTPHGTLAVTEPRGTVGYFFANPGRRGYSEPYTFYIPKAEGTVRLVLVGGSVIKGFPQPRAFAASSFLKEMLSDCWPDRTVEVINLGTTAVASFPVRNFLRQALDYDPDLVVVCTGHNEFYGAYGVASINQAGSAPWMLDLQYRMRGLGLFQALNRLVRGSGRGDSRKLMEVMVGQDYLGPTDWRRKAAANLLYHHVGSMIQMSQDDQIPVLVCVLPANERDLAPIGSDRAKADVEQVVNKAKRWNDEQPQEAITELQSLVERRPDSARAHYYLGKALFAAEDYAAARVCFLRARDLDPMPWRAPTQSQQAIRRAVEEHGTELCDVEAVFRKHSPGGATGWELMDDHVHPSLEGQALLARAIVESLTDRSDRLRVPADRLESLPVWQTYAKRLGDNLYDRYGVAHTVRVLFKISFMRASNLEAYQRFDLMARDYEGQMPPEILKIARKWQTKRPHAGAKRPVSGMVARGLLRENRVDEALGLFEAAQRCVPEFSSWHLEYAYFRLACLAKLHGELDPAGLAVAAQEIERGLFLLKHGHAESGLTERYVGRLHQLRGEYAEAIPLLRAARPKLHGFDLVAADQALIMSYVQTGDVESARRLAMNGVEHSGQYAELYRAMLGSLPATR